MAKVIGKEPLCVAYLKYFKAVQGIGGRTLFDRYKLAEKNILHACMDPAYREFLAYPVQEDNSITFYGKKYQETPRLLSDLRGDDLEKYTNIKTETLAHYNSRIDSLRDAGKTTEAEFLADAIKYIDDRFVYCYDDKVVLGVWGMRLRENVRADISEISKDLTLKEKVQADPGILVDKPGEDPSEERVDEDTPVIPPDVPVIDSPTPVVVPTPSPYVFISGKLPWYKRFWRWLCGLFAGKGCLRWLLRFLLFLLLLLLLLFLLRHCIGCSSAHQGGGAGLGDNDSTWLREDPNRGYDGGIYDPYNPYTPVPTPPGYEDILPPQQGVLPPVENDPDILPGNPSIIANRLNILMENKDKSILELARDFKQQYPDERYQVVYYDDVVKRMQIEIPREERQQLKQAIPGQFAPEYELFVFDEALFEGAYTPNDPAFSDADKSWYLNTIRAPQAWDITRGSEKIMVAIVDNGFNLKHPELSSKVVQPYNVWTHSPEIFPQEVDHGTHVAGTALALADNGKGLCGIAPNCGFMPVQVANQWGMMTTTSVLDGILYALYQGADVVNVSLGSQFTGLSEYPESVQQELIRNRFKEEERLWREIMRIAANHNSTVVVAAGNDNVLAGIDALQRPELFITVSAVDKDNQRLDKASFSNYGSYSTLSAPGVDMYSTVGKNEYQVMSGTSMAAPVVAGAVALMKSINDTLTSKQIICILQHTGLETQGNIGKLLQLDKALEVVKSGEVIDCTPPPSTGDVQILLSWNNYNDLDLICTDPLDETVFFRNRRTSSGGQLEIDMNVEYPDSKTPIENIYWEPGCAPDGTYNVYLLYYQRHGSEPDETPYTVYVTYDGKTEDYTGTIKKEDNVIHICTFTLETDGNHPRDSLAHRPNIPPDHGRCSQLEQERDRLQQELDRVNNELRRIGNSR